MSCGTCSEIKTEGAPAGCRNNGTCSTSGCNMLNVYDWLSDMSTPEGKSPCDIVEVCFKGSRKEFFRNKDHFNLLAGEAVAVESSPGHDIGVVSLTGELVRLQLKKKGLKEDAPDMKIIYRKAKQTDVEKWDSYRKMEQKTMMRAREIALHFKLVMKISDVEYQGDGKKATFFYTAEDRVDFRELIRKYAEEFRVRIEMRQIGMRQEASRLGGIGSCGRELCCSTWLTDFRAVTTGAARYQNLALNPQKMAGQCGKLKCCLNYELDTYLDALKDLPENTIALETKKGTAHHRKTDIFKRIMWYSYSSQQRSGEDPSEQQQGIGYSDTWVALPVNRVKEIIDLNKKSIRPDDLAEKIMYAPKIKEPDFENVVGQDSITRMDRKKKPRGRNDNRRRPQRRRPPEKK